MDIGRDGDHHYCFSCGRKWSAKDRFPLWPIRVKLSINKTLYSKHAVQVGYADIGVRVFKTILKLGILRFIFGPDRAEFDRAYIPEWGKWIEKKDEARVKASLQRDKDVDEIISHYSGKFE